MCEIIFQHVLTSFVFTLMNSCFLKCFEWCLEWIVVINITVTQSASKYWSKCWYALGIVPHVKHSRPLPNQSVQFLMIFKGVDITIRDIYVITQRTRISVCFHFRDVHNACQVLCMCYIQSICMMFTIIHYFHFFTI